MPAEDEPYYSRRPRTAALSHHARSAEVDPHARGSLSYGSNVRERSMIWQLAGLSWLPCSLKHEQRECTASDPFEVDPEDHDSWFVLVFSPEGGSLEEARTPAPNTYMYSDSLYTACGYSL